jgi:hypothetical protein
MNPRLASILKDKIAAFTYVDRIAGLVRVISYEREGAVIKVPVAVDVQDDLACDDSTQRDLVPDEQYACMVYFEDGGTTRTTSRTRGTSYRSNLRLVCWINTAKFSGDVTAGDKILQEFLNLLDDRAPYNAETLIGIRQAVEGMPKRGPEIFSQYTYPDSTRQYLMWPFDAFAIDLSVEYRVKPGCEEEPVPGDDSCWHPPVTRRRKDPKDFTCEELTDPVTGLTAAQLGPECLDCEGGGPCDPTTVNGTESDTPTILVQQGGVNVGTLNPATGVHTVPECDPCPPCEDAEVTFASIPLLSIPSGDTEDIDCDTLLDAVVVSGASETQKNGTYTPDGTLNGRTKYSAAPNHTIEWNGSQYINRDIFVGTDWITNNAPANPWSGVWVEFVGGAAIDGTVAQATIGTFCAVPCDPLTVTVNDEPFDEVAEPCGGLVNVRVANEELEAVGEEIDGFWIVPTAKTLCTLITEGTSAEVATCVTSSGKRAGVLAELIPTVDDADVLAQIIAPLTPSQDAVVAVTVQLQDSGGTDIGSPDVYAPGTSTTKTAPDATVQLVDTDDINIGSPVNFPSGTSDTLFAPNGSVTIRNSVPTTLHTVAVKSNGTATQDIADSTITKPDGTTVGLAATVALDVRNYRSGIAYNFGRILHSGQETVYQAGDEGTMYADGFFNYTRPVYPTHYAELGANFTTLAANNVWGNTLRFTDRAGAAAASSGNRFIQDHLTGLEYYVLGTYLTAATWNAAVTAGVTINATLGETGWYLPNDRVLDSITNDNSGTFITGDPFSAPGGTTNIWTSSTGPGTTTGAKFLGSPAGQVGQIAKTTNTFIYGIFVRRLP